MNIREFNKQMVNGEYARTNLYSVQISMPPGIEFYHRTEDVTTEDLAYRAKSVSLPGKSLGTIEARRFGPVFKVANDLIVDTVAISFVCSPSHLEHRFFEGWISAIMGRDAQWVEKKRQIYTLSYYDSYVGSVDIIPLKRGFTIEEDTAHVTLLEAYPTNVGPIAFAWGESSEVASFDVTFSFRDYIWTAKGEDNWLNSPYYSARPPAPTPPEPGMTPKRPPVAGHPSGHVARAPKKEPKSEHPSGHQAKPSFLS